jgi:flagellar protein FlbD
MIMLHRLNQQEFVLNADLIETLEATPDTLVTLTTGKKMLVRDGIKDVLERVITYRQLCHSTIQVVQTEKKEVDETKGSPEEAAGGPNSGMRGRAN